MVDWKQWLKAALIRAIRTFAEAMIAYIGTGAVVIFSSSCNFNYFPEKTIMNTIKTARGGQSPKSTIKPNPSKSSVLSGVLPIIISSIFPKS